ncbi:hypothetical protein [Anoxynatronum buryatiense]|uniref:Threonine kinase n=1 Tax=Anoxynatronum buryatiense TaxID=489973 RepID=A0AA45WWA5_9CLOT|nr:hypothetical protein [Anoxynatronum buryatiense]SMP56310.1 threonine kinase [Anoxynatronum buryatiense]
MKPFPPLLQHPITARCPGSCGEFLQGWLDGSEKLISYAIDCYSQVTLTPVPAADAHAAFRRDHPRAWELTRAIVENYLGADADQTLPITLTLESQLPRAKGMASSTADLAATAAALLTWLNQPFDGEILTRLCTQLEPTDSIIHSRLALMDPLTGEVIRSYQQLPPLQVLVLEGLDAVETAGFRRENHALRREAQQRELAEALKYFEEALALGDMEALAAACWISARANQMFYPLPGLETLHHLALRHGAWGLNIAHSGSTVALLHDPRRFRFQAFLDDWHREPAATRYFPPRRHRLIPGGVTVTERKESP